MFSTIAARYDRCNHWFSVGIDRLWRRRLANLLDVSADAVVLDVCCGTGDMAFALLTYTCATTVVGLDCSETMIQLAQEKQMLQPPHRRMDGKEVRFCVGDATSLPFEDAAFDAATCVFGLRNIPDRAAALGQLHRVLKPGGQLGVCEFSLPTQPAWRRVYLLYLSRVMPLLGRVVVGSAEPLRYLSDSICRWHDTVRLDDELRAAGFTDIRHTPNTGGIVTFTTAARP